MIDVWINGESGWNVALIESQYINISTYRPLSGIFYMNLPVEFRSLKKGLINMEKTDQKCFLWCGVSYINLLKQHPERIRRMIKKLLKNLTMMELSFQCKNWILTILK